MYTRTYPRTPIPENYGGVALLAEREADQADSPPHVEHGAEMAGDVCCESECEPPREDTAPCEQSHQSEACAPACPTEAEDGRGGIPTADLLLVALAALLTQSEEDNELLLLLLLLLLF